MEPARCRHEGCRCEAPRDFGYCSVYCKTAADAESAKNDGTTGGDACQCGHPPCS